MFGCHPGQLAQGYQILLLKDAVVPDDLDVSAELGYQAFQARSGVHGRRSMMTKADRNSAIVIDMISYASDRLARELADAIRQQGPDRLVKIVPLHGPPPMRAAPQASRRRAPRMLNLSTYKTFLVAAEIDAHSWFIGRGLSLELGAHTRYDQRSSIVSYLAAA
jgi:hypothetical protein